ncbi:hypothetical protein SYNPS1DRAFT_29455 [Syncephalis pseudoplumigaleata]|uniref:Uncharacterized protein n=1 Tax=Syncephalis pseudoplumigaleata TaxID=1712513 RepID=A0A4P9YXP7_9FUNG|nr:hypothetical protein SYNPS1DRAFT_29455 [Syncephalis pseudoplumigaleata]|eukprot:RKP24794.1 hypothetical protein SYNPS1DRAFT_29455 [Syncephalis pseudoplumigaleata]
MKLPRSARGEQMETATMHPLVQPAATGPSMAHVRNTRRSPLHWQQLTSGPIMSSSSSSSLSSCFSPTTSDTSVSSTIDTSHSSLLHRTPSPSSSTSSSSVITRSYASTIDASLSTRTGSKFSFVHELVADDMPRHNFTDSPAFNTRSRSKAAYAAHRTGQPAGRQAGGSVRSSGRPFAKREAARVDAGQLTGSFLREVDRWLQPGGSLLSLAVSAGPNSPGINRLARLLGGASKRRSSTTVQKRPRHHSPIARRKAVRLRSPGILHEDDLRQLDEIISPRGREHR